MEIYRGTMDKDDFIENNNLKTHKNQYSLYSKNITQSEHTNKNDVQVFNTSSR